MPIRGAGRCLFCRFSKREGAQPPPPQASGKPVPQARARRRSRRAAPPVLHLYQSMGAWGGRTAAGRAARRVSTTQAEGAPAELRPRFCTFIKAWGCRAGAPQRGGLPARVSTTGAEARPRILRGNGRMQDMAGGLVQSAKNVNKR